MSNTNNGSKKETALLTKEEALEYAEVRTKLIFAMLAWVASCSAGVALPIIVLLLFLFFPGPVYVSSGTYWIMTIGFILLAPTYLIFNRYRQRFEELRNKIESTNKEKDGP